jgi:hypothetical protein
MSNRFVHIVCSDESRNGKTLFARLYCDMLELRGADTLRIFDTDHPHGALARWFPGRAEIVDLSRTQGQVFLFDTIIAEPQYNYVIDLQAPLLERFFDIFADIRFDEGAREAGIGVAVFFMIDKHIQSIEAARKVRAKLSCSQFICVRNEAIGSPVMTPAGAGAYLSLPKDRDIVLPKLSQKALGVIDEEGFTFSGFLSGDAEKTPLHERYEIWNFLETIYNQKKTGASGVTLAI